MIVTCPTPRSSSTRNNSSGVSALATTSSSGTESATNLPAYTASFLGANGARMNRYAADRTVKRLARRAGITKRISPHSLRHSFITAALDAGVPLRDVQEAASHADPRTTMRYDRADKASTDTPPTSLPRSSPEPHAQRDRPTGRYRAPVSPDRAATARTEPTVPVSVVECGSRGRRYQAGAGNTATSPPGSPTYSERSGSVATHNVGTNAPRAVLTLDVRASSSCVSVNTILQRPDPVFVTHCCRVQRAGATGSRRDRCCARRSSFATPSLTRRCRRDRHGDRTSHVRFRHR